MSNTYVNRTSIAVHPFTTEPVWSSHVFYTTGTYENFVGEEGKRMMKTVFY